MCKLIDRKRHLMPNPLRTVSQDCVALGQANLLLDLKHRPAQKCFLFLSEKRVCIPLGLCPVPNMLPRLAPDKGPCRSMTACRRNVNRDTLVLLELITDRKKHVMPITLRTLSKHCGSETSKPSTRLEAQAQA